MFPPIAVSKNNFQNWLKNLSEFVLFYNYNTKISNSIPNFKKNKVYMKKY